MAKRTPPVDAKSLEAALDLGNKPSTTANAASRPVCPEVATSLLGQAFFTWISPLLVKGAQQPLVADDLWALHKAEECHGLFESYRTKPPARLWLTKLVFGSNETSLRLWEMGSPALTRSAILMATYSLAVLTEPLLVRELVTSIHHDTVDGAYYAIGLFFVACGGAICNQMHFHLAFRTWHYHYSIGKCRLL